MHRIITPENKYSIGLINQITKGSGMERHTHRCSVENHHQSIKKCGEIKESANWESPSG
jgi:hypothetical protein